VPAQFLDGQEVSTVMDQVDRDGRPGERMAQRGMAVSTMVPGHSRALAVGAAILAYGSGPPSSMASRLAVNDHREIESTISREPITRGCISSLVPVSSSRWLASSQGSGATYSSLARPPRRTRTMPLPLKSTSVYIHFSNLFVIMRAHHPL
jgi:hypothetical protein